MDRRDFITRGAAGAFGASLSSLSGHAADKGKQPPNLVFVFADQMQSRVLGCYGGQQVQTPHLDRLAEDGARFRNALSTWPVCSPYRAMLMTGRFPMRNGTVTNDTAVRDDLPTVAGAFRRRGYATGYIGKWHLGWDRNPFVPRSERLGFDYWAVRNCSHAHFDSFYCADNSKPIPLPGYEPAAQTQLALNYMRRHRREPFCLFVSWGPPHDPYKAPDDYMARFPPAELKLPPNAGETAMVSRLLETNPMPKSAGRAVKRRATLRKMLADERAFRRDCLQGYLAATKALDDCIGTLLTGIAQLGLRENTILVFTSDHGDMMGSHNTISKQMPHEESIGIPFLVRYPGVVPEGTVTDALLRPVDIMPTLLDLAGLPCPEVDGVSMAAAARGGPSDQIDAALIMKMMPGGNPWMVSGVTPWRGVRTKRYTYARLLDRGPWVLYDNESDPAQLSNLIDDPAHAHLRKRLDALTDRLMAEAGDPGDTAEISEFRSGRHRAWLESKRVAKCRFELAKGDALERENAPQIGMKTFRIEAEFEASENGVIVAQGGIGSGYSLYVKGGLVHFTTRHKGPAFEVCAKQKLTPGRHRAVAELTAANQIVLTVDTAEPVAAKTIGLIPKLPGDGLEVGADRLHAVSESYASPNEFKGAIHRVVVIVGE